MRSERRLIAVLKSTTSEQRYESIWWFVYNLFGSTVPIWLGGYLILPIFLKHFDWIEYSSHGELALYSAAFLAPTLRLIGKDVEDSIFVRRQMFIFLGWISLTAAVALYSAVIVASKMPLEAVTVNTKLLFGVSLFLFVFSVMFASVVRLIDFQRIQPRQVFATEEAHEKRLDDEFDKTATPSGQVSNEIIRETTNQQAGAYANQGLATAGANPDETSDVDSSANEGAGDGTRQD